MPTEAEADTDLLSPAQFAKVLNVSPQMVYYWIRKGVIDTEQCQCGGKLIRVSQARERLAARRRETENGY